MAVMVIGRQGSGKTTFAMRTLYHYYGDWDKVFNSMTFNIVELLRKSKHYDAMLIDDAGVHLSKYDWQKKTDFAKFYNLIRDVTNFLIFTTPDEGDILKSVRDKITYLVIIKSHVRPVTNKKGEIVRWEHWKDGGTAYVYKKRVVFVDGKPDYRYRAEGIITFKYELPEDVRKRYAEMRAKVTEELLNELLGESPTARYEDFIEKIKAKAKLYYDKANDSYKLRLDDMITLPKEIAESIFSGAKNTTKNSPQNASDSENQT
nr:hypothetical protein [Sulfolobus islandicus]